MAQAAARCAHAGVKVPTTTGPESAFRALRRKDRREVALHAPKRRSSDGHGLICPVPRTRYLKLVSCSTPTGPRACSLPVAMPISAPKPNSPPSANWRRGVVQHDRGIDLVRKFLRRRLSAGDDRVGMMGAVALDVLDRRFQPPIDHAGGVILSTYSVTSPARWRVSRAYRPSARRTSRSILAAGVEQHGR